jgi:hypothetical protein
VTWQNECQDRGGMVTAIDVNGTYTPVCRVGVGADAQYLDMRSISETWDDSAQINEDNWNILLGEAVSARDAVVDTTKAALKWSFGTIAIAGAIGLALFAYLEKKK